MNFNSSLSQRTKTVSNRARKILLVEDDLHWQMVMSRVLKSLDENIVIRCVRNAKQAHEALANSPNYDLIIADHFIDGEVTGFDFWKECRTRHHRIPFVMISSMTESEFVKLTKQAGHPIFVSKPFEVEDLKSLLTWQLGMPSDKASLTK